MSRIVFDIETIGADFDALDLSQQEYLLKYAETEEDAEAVKESLGLYPLTGEIVTIGLMNPDTLKGVLYFQAPGKDTLRRMAYSMRQVLKETYWRNSGKL